VTDTAESWRRAHAALVAVVERSPDITALLADDGTVEYGSHALETMLGRWPQGLLGRPFAALVHLELTERGELDAPYVITWEGSVCDERTVGDGFWSGLGTSGDGGQGTSNDWLRRLAPRAAALVAVGTCGAWGGVPSGKGNPTGAMGVGAFLGDEYRSAAWLPVVNVPGCAPLGDNYTERPPSPGAEPAGAATGV
jgi:PAS domain-containing protein